MKYEELNGLLGQRFPNLLPKMAAETDTFDCYKPGPHVLYGNVLNSYVTDLLIKNDSPALLASVFKFYEELARSDDIAVKNLLQVTLLESLWDDPNVYNNAVSHMLPETKKINSYIEEYLKKPK